MSDFLKEGKTEFPDSIREFFTKDKTMTFRIKWDGCFDIARFYNGDTKDAYDENNRDEMHFCELPELIALLTELNEKTKEWIR